MFHFPFLNIFKQIVLLWTWRNRHLLILLWVFVTDSIVNSEHEMSTAKRLCYMAPPVLVSKCQPRKWWKTSVRPTLGTIGVQSQNSSHFPVWERVGWGNWADGLFCLWRGVLRLDPNLTWWAYQAISLLSRPGTLSAGGLISPLFSLSLWWHLWSAAAN